MLLPHQPQLWLKWLSRASTLPQVARALLAELDALPPERAAMLPLLVARPAWPSVSLPQARWQTRYADYQRSLTQ